MSSGITKCWMMSGLSAGTVNASAIRTTRSGGPSCQPAVKVGSAGSSSGSPGSQPPSAQAVIVSISFWVSRRSPRKGWASLVAGIQGGMIPAEIVSTIIGAWAATSAHVVSGKGATSPGRWHDTQRAWTIGATSRAYVRVVFKATAAAISSRHPTGATNASAGAFPAATASTASASHRFVIAGRRRPTARYASSIAPR